MNMKNESNAFQIEIAVNLKTIIPFYKDIYNGPLLYWIRKSDNNVMFDL